MGNPLKILNNSIITIKHDKHFNSILLNEYNTPKNLIIDINKVKLNKFVDFIICNELYWHNIKIKGDISSNLIYIMLEKFPKIIVNITNKKISKLRRMNVFGNKLFCKHLTLILNNEVLNESNLKFLGKINNRFEKLILKHK